MRTATAMHTVSRALKNFPFQPPFTVATNDLDSPPSRLEREAVGRAEIKRILKQSRKNHAHESGID